MERNKMSAMAMIAVILGAAGLGVGAYSVISVQTGAIEGEDGDDGDTGATGLIGPEGDEGDDGQDAPGGIVIGIMDPDDGEIISGNVTIRAMVAGSENYDVKVYINGSLNATIVPFVWNSSKVSDGWWNVTVIATDVATNDVSQDEVIIYVDNSPVQSTPRAKAYKTGSQSFDINVWQKVDFDAESYDTTDSFNLGSDTYVIPEDGWYLIIGSLYIAPPGDGYVFTIAIYNMSDTSIITANLYFSEGNPSSIDLHISDIIWFSAGTFVDLRVRRNGGSGIIQSNYSSSYMIINKLEE